jgi:RND family efflux transporter MFP subunit
LITLSFLGLLLMWVSMSQQRGFLKQLKMVMIILGLLTVLILLAIQGVFTQHNAESENEESAGQVLPEHTHTLKISSQATSNTLSWQGVVNSRLAVNIQPKITARLIEVVVHPGDKLKKGDLIARLDDRELHLAANAANSEQVAAQAQAAQDRAEEMRVIDLYHKQEATRQRYDEVLAKAQASQALVQQATNHARQALLLLTENRITAPFDGVVSERLLEPGNTASPSQAIVTFYKPDDFRLEVAIADHCVPLISLGLHVSVRIDAIFQTLTGTIDEISAEIDPDTHTQPIKISLPPTAGLQQGQSGSLELSCQATQQALLVPASALLQFGQLQAVKVVEGDESRIRHIRLGKRYGDQYEVLYGLHEGDEIVTDVSGKP